jgi:biopolymer transport protein ExbD
MNFRKNLQSNHPGFQLAPMIDVVFLLLIFFMVTMIFAQWETKIGIEVPTADSSVMQTRRPGEIIVNLDKEGHIFINNVELSPDRLEALLSNIAHTFAGNPVIIRADRETNHESVMLVLDVCRKVDIWNVSFATLPEKEDAPAP